MQFHSLPISELPALAGSFIAGLTGYGVASLVTTDHNAKLWTGYLTSIAFNVAMGAPINLSLLDFLGMIVARPISAFVGAKLLAAVVNSSFLT